LFNHDPAIICSIPRHQAPVQPEPFLQRSFDIVALNGAADFPVYGNREPVIGAVILQKRKKKKRFRIRFPFLSSFLKSSSLFILQSTGNLNDIFHPRACKCAGIYMFKPGIIRHPKAFRQV
jgi:hypothetical protein